MWDKKKEGIIPMQELLRQKKLRKAEGLIHLQDVETGKRVAAHGGSVYWNQYRRRWVAIILESLAHRCWEKSDTPSPTHL